ncbi:MAG: family 43 glycosylhydrolase [Chitinispirillaceae bacterium]|nr:family 43 glycosylhydrolase [Chitinispirillaceae bacterium]
MKKIALIFSIMSLTVSSYAANPIATNMYTADAATLVYRDTLYVFTGHDCATVNQWPFVMPDWLLFSTTDMVNWTQHGAILHDHDFTWIPENYCWASQCIERNGKYYWYVCNWGNIGIAVGNSIFGPYTDPLGVPLITPSTPGAAPNNIDPTIFIDDDGTPYLYWGGNGNMRAAKVKKNMIELDGSIRTITGCTGYEEAPWLHKRNGVYYLAYSTSTTATGPLRYATASNPFGPWTVRGDFFPAAYNSWTNHDAIAHYKGKSYLVYHNGMLPRGGGYKRSVCVDSLVYNTDGTIRMVVATTAGVRAAPPAENLAFRAAGTASFCSADETVLALNDGYDPSSSRSRMYDVYTNAPQTTAPWVVYTWSSAVAVGRIEVYWFEDTVSTSRPLSYSVEYWNGSAYSTVNNPVGLGTSANQYNSTTFTPVNTTRLRLSMTPQSGRSTGIMEWKVYAGQVSAIGVFHGKEIDTKRFFVTGVSMKNIGGLVALSYTAQSASPVAVEVYSMKGVLVAGRFNENHAPGPHTIWLKTAAGLARGSYLITFTAGSMKHSEICVLGR